MSYLTLLEYLEIDDIFFRMPRLVGDRLVDLFLRHEKVEFKKGEVIIESSRPVDNVYYIEKGFVKLLVYSKDGGELVINIFKPGSFFPVAWVLGNVPNHCDFVAFTDVVAYKTRGLTITEFIKDNKDEMFLLLERLCRGLVGITTQMEYLLFGSAKNKIVSVILVLAKRFGEEVGYENIHLEIGLTHSDIASMAGLTRETASIELKKLEKDGLIGWEKKRLIIKKMQKLEDYAVIDKDEVRVRSIS